LLQLQKQPSLMVIHEKILPPSWDAGDMLTMQKPQPTVVMKLLHRQNWFQSTNWQSWFDHGLIKLN
jgi:hypothetical protein